MAMFRITSSKVVPYTVRAISSRGALCGFITNTINGCDQNSEISHHHYSTDYTKKQIDDKLVKIIKSEIKLKQMFIEREHRADDNPEFLLPMNCPFTIKDNPWEEHVTLSRDFNGEKIYVVVTLHCCSHLLEDKIDSTNLNNIDDADISSSDDDSDDESKRLRLRQRVKISKENGNVFEIIVYAYADGEMRICNYSILKEYSESSQPLRRFGPYYVREGGELEGALKEFLKNRGITRSNCNYTFLYEYMIRKYKNSPMVTLKELRKFIAD